MPVTLDSIKDKMVGKTYGKLTILSYVGKSERGDNLWKARCECGTIIVNRTSGVDKPFSACPKCKRNAGPKAQQRHTYLLGKVFGRLTVKEYEGSSQYQAGLWRGKWTVVKKLLLKVLV